MTESPTVALPRYGLYYPYIHFRDARWLKMAALYWPRLARIVPRDYPTRDADLVLQLVDELDFVVDIDPDPATSAVAAAFLAAVDDLMRELGIEYPLRADYGRYGQPSPAGDEPDSLLESPRWQISGPSGVNPGELDPTLINALVDRGLASLTEDQQWVVMDNDLAWAYKCLLSTEIASRNALTLTTDQVQAHAAAGISAGDLVTRRLGREVPPPPDTDRAETDYGAMFGLMSLNLVVPEDLAATSIEKIITVRKRYGDEFDRWRRHVDLVAAELSEQLRGIDSPDILDAYLRDAVQQLSGRPLDALRRGLRDVGLDATQTAITMKYALPAGLAAAGLAAVEPHLAAAAGVGIGIFGLARRLRGGRRAQRAASPAAYLLEVDKQLSPESALDRAGRMLRLVSGGTRR